MLVAAAEEELVLAAEVEEMLRMETMGILRMETMGTMRMETTLVIKVTEEMDQALALATGAPTLIFPVLGRLMTMETPIHTINRVPLVL